MTTTTTTDLALTSEHVKAIRNADDWISFRYKDGEEEYGPEFACLDASRRHDPGDGFGKRELHSLIPMATPLFTGYGAGENASLDRRKVATAYWSVSSPSVARTWQSIVALIRKGDVLRGAWTTGNNSENLRNANLNADEFRLVIERNGKRQQFLVGYQIVTTHTPMRCVTWADA